MYRNSIVHKCNKFVQSTHLASINFTLAIGSGRIISGKTPAVLVAHWARAID